ncbi:MAG TPA: tRNA (guanosine(37)-N1)-methyltransferase TrmD, partial [Rhodanobacteraceae bacterium]|nr:tRNA (guanosine(37)-N1)-methyltransferase TrmD [Rhodanobacteraceae bacterium]
MRIDVVTLFPEFVRQCAGFGVIGRAVERGLLEVEAWNPRDYAEGGYRRVDDSACGGGPGMVLLIEPLRKALA